MGQTPKLGLWCVALILGGLCAFSLRHALEHILAVHPAKSASLSSSFGTQQSPWRSERPDEPVLAESLIHGATLQYYPVDGDTWEQLAANVKARGGTTLGTDAKTTFHLLWHAGNPNDGACGLSTGRVTAETVVTMPCWSIMPNNTDEAKQWWSYFVHRLADQQQQHVVMAQSTADEATLELRQASCATGDSLWASINAKGVAAQQAYDAAHGNEETDLRFEPSYESIVSPGGPSQAPSPPAPQSSPAAAALPEGPGFEGQLPRGQYAADFSLELRTLEGSSVPLESKRGQVIFLNFWATWCGPCRAEEPDLDKLYAEFKDKNIFFAFVTPESTVVVKTFLALFHWNIPVYQITAQAESPYVSSGIPTTLIISKKGDVALKVVGSRRWDTPEVAKYLDSLIDE